MGFPPRLDRHVFNLALGPFLVGTISALGLYLVVDVFSSLGRISSALTDGATASQVARYYVLKIPTIFSMSFPLIFCISIVVSVIGFTRRTEDLCCLSCGISIRKALRAIFISAILFTGLFFVCNDYFIPTVSSSQTKLKAQLFKKESSLKNVTTEEKSKDRRVIFQIARLERTPTGLSAKDFHCYVSSKEGKSEIHSLFATWERETGTWILQDGKLITHRSKTDRKIELIGAFSSSLNEADYVFHLPPSSFQIRDLWILKSQHTFRYELFARILNPIALLLLCLILIPAANELSRRGVYKAVAFSLVTAIGYYGFTFLLSASSSTLSAEVSAAIPLLIILAYGLWTFARVKT